MILSVGEVELGGRKVFLELQREIVAKKVVYRWITWCPGAESNFLASP
jgi:hypothetical protein